MTWSITTVVEGLRQTDGALHIVQDAIVTHHGAQCGFCTPGFVMSLYAGYENGLDDNRQHIQQILSGNLCRCTGYGALIDADVSAARHKPSPQEQTTQLARRDDELRYLKMRKKETEMLVINRSGLFMPETVIEPENLTTRFPDATFLAGGADIGLWVTKQHRQINRFIYLGAVDALKSITRDDTSIHIGAAVSHAEAMDILAEDYLGLGEVWQRFGSAQVRYSGTGRNIANGSPIGDLSPCFLALGAELTSITPVRKRRLSLDDFFISYGKQDKNRVSLQEKALPCHVWVLMKPVMPIKYLNGLIRIFRRSDMASKVRLDGRVIKDIRIGFGGVAATPSRAHEVEQVLAGHDCDPTPALNR